jgi:hypothetical protein
MIAAQYVIAISSLVVDSGGVHPLKPIPNDAADAIAAHCNEHPNYSNPAVPGIEHCAAVYVNHSFQESGWNLHAVGDGGHSFGPFQVQGRAPSSWKDAVSQFATLLHRASVCPEPLEMLATGKCGTEVGQQISRVRMRAAAGLVALIWLNQSTPRAPRANPRTD